MTLRSPVTLGLIEGFFGPPWPWPARHAALGFLAEHGFGAYLYAPKADRYLRGQWRVDHPPDEAAALRAFFAAADDARIQPLVGLSPLALHEAWDSDGRDDLLRRVDALRDLGVRGLGLFFDDMRGDVPSLATHQAQMAQAVHDRHPDLPLWLCPTYYTDDPVLDRVFGQRPARYLEALGDALPEAVQVFWTGDRVCSTTYDPDALRAVRERLGRPLALWDNYPVNDGPRMCKRLHLRPPAGRGPEAAAQVSSWFFNPMNQPVASRLPLAAMAASLRGEAVDLDALARRLYGDRVAPALLAWMDRFQDEGLDRWQDDPQALATFDGAPGEAAAEVRAWLRGDYLVGPECLTDTEA